MSSTKQETITIDVPMEVKVRRHQVNIEGLKKLLRYHRKSPLEIANLLGCPVTKAEHWFRTDRYSAIPDEDLWLELKRILGIQTDEFDASIMEFDYRDGNYDMRGRIHMGGVAPTLSTQASDLYLVPDRRKDNPS